MAKRKLISHAEDCLKNHDQEDKGNYVENHKNLAIILLHDMPEVIANASHAGYVANQKHQIAGPTMNFSDTCNSFFLRPRLVSIVNSHGGSSHCPCNTPKDGQEKADCS